MLYMIQLGCDALNKIADDIPWKMSKFNQQSESKSLMPSSCIKLGKPKEKNTQNRKKRKQNRKKCEIKNEMLQANEQLKRKHSIMDAIHQIQDRHLQSTEFSSIITRMADKLNGKRVLKRLNVIVNQRDGDFCVFLLFSIFFLYSTHRCWFSIVFQWHLLCRPMEGPTFQQLQYWPMILREST